MEAAAFGGPRPCLVAFDARAGRVYVQGFGVGPEPPELADADALADMELATGLSCLGDCAEPLAEKTGGTATPPAFPVAEAIARIAR